MLLISSVAVAIVAAEIGFRAADLFKPRPRTFVGENENRESKNFAWSPEVGWRMHPGHRFKRVEHHEEIEYAADSRGFRIDPSRKPRSATTFAAIGDSFTFGAGVQASDSYPVLLAEHLGGLDVLNVAQPGYALDQVWQACILHAIPAKPAFIVAGIYPEDLERSLSAYRQHEGLNKPTFKLEDGALTPTTRADSPGALVRFLDAKSRVFAVWRQTSALLGSRYGFGEMWNLNAAMIDDMISAATRAGIPIVFVHIPTKNLDPFPALGGHLAKRGALYLDPVESMKACAETLYFLGNMHLNAAGHRFVADELRRFFEAHPEILAQHKAAASRRN